MTAARAETIEVDGIVVTIEGPSQGPTVLMIHGWPDTDRLWEPGVRTLSPHFRCARFTVAGSDVDLPRRPMSLADHTALVLRIADAVSASEPVILLMHDWGCVIGWEFAMRHPERVLRIVAVDVGDATSRDFPKSLSAREKAIVVGYQTFLAAAWRIGGRPGDAMTRAMARLLGAPSPRDRIGSTMNSFYDMTWTGSYGSLRNALPVDPHCPTLYFWGSDKPAQFQTPGWASRIASRPGNEVIEMPTGHWVMVDAETEFYAKTIAWLRGSPAS